MPTKAPQHASQVPAPNGCKPQWRHKPIQTGARLIPLFGLCSPSRDRAEYQSQNETRTHCLAKHVTCATHWHGMLASTRHHSMPCPRSTNCFRHHMRRPAADAIRFPRKAGARTLIQHASSTCGGSPVLHWPDLSPRIETSRLLGPFFARLVLPNPKKRAHTRTQT